MRSGQRGFCFVRMGTDDGVALTTYGRSSGFCIDPIEKKPLNHFYPGSSVFSFGTAGCNLGCKFCQNWDISKADEMDRLMDSASPAAIAAAAKRHGSRSIAFTYNDPIVFAEYAIDTAEEARALGLKTVAVSNGYITEAARPEFFAAMDAANIDLKAFTPEFYKQLCLGEIEPVKDTLRYLTHETNTWLEVTTLIIPGHNDNDRELEKLARFMVEDVGPTVPLHFSAFHPDYRMLDVPPTPHATLLRARDIAMKAGCEYVYVGNVHDRAASSTWCPACKSLLVERDWYELGHWGLDANGCCASCGHKIPGHFAARPGDFGSRRLPVRMS